MLIRMAREYSYETLEGRLVWIPKGEVQVPIMIMAVGAEDFPKQKQKKDLTVDVGKRKVMSTTS